MRVALIQMPVTADREGNLRTAAEKLRQAAAGGADIAVLPEMFCCPYENRCFRPYGEEAGGPARLLTIGAEAAVFIGAAEHLRQDGNIRPSGRRLTELFGGGAEISLPVRRHRHLDQCYAHE